jgi:hypothetical protein
MTAQERAEPRAARFPAEDLPAREVTASRHGDALRQRRTRSP